METPKIGAAVLAAGMITCPDNPVLEQEKAGLVVGGIPLFQHATNALIGSGTTKPLVIARKVPVGDGYQVCTGSDSLVANVRMALNRVKTPEMVLCCGDLPFASTGAIEDLLDEAKNLEADFIYTVARADRCATHYPGMTKTSVSLKDGRFCGGSVFVIKNRDAAIKATDKLSDMYAARKDPVALAVTLGARATARAILAKIWPGSLSIQDGEAILSRCFGMKVRIVEVHPCLAVDIDRWEQYLEAKRIWAHMRDPAYR